MDNNKGPDHEQPQNPEFKNNPETSAIKGCDFQTKTHSSHSNTPLHGLHYAITTVLYK